MTPAEIRAFRAAKEKLDKIKQEMGGPSYREIIKEVERCNPAFQGHGSCKLIAQYLGINEKTVRRALSSDRKRKKETAMAMINAGATVEQLAEFWGCTTKAAAQKMERCREVIKEKPQTLALEYKGATSFSITFNF